MAKYLKGTRERERDCFNEMSKKRIQELLTLVLGLSELRSISIDDEVGEERGEDSFRFRRSSNSSVCDWYQNGRSLEMMIVREKVLVYHVLVTSESVVKIPL